MKGEGGGGGGGGGYESRYGSKGKSEFETTENGYKYFPLSFPLSLWDIILQSLYISLQILFFVSFSFLMQPYNYSKSTIIVRW